MPNTSIALYLSDDDFVRYAKNKKVKEFANHAVREILRDFLDRLDSDEDLVKKIESGKVVAKTTSIKIIDKE